jgi:hypothetical protein
LEHSFDVSLVFETAASSSLFADPRTINLTLSGFEILLDFSVSLMPDARTIE